MSKLCRTVTRVIVFVLLLAPASLEAQATPGLVDNRQSPHAAVRSVGLDDVRWTHGFWADRFENCRTRMIPNMWALMQGTNYSHYLQNFRIAAGLAEGRYRGAPFNDGDFYKWLEAACAMFAVTRDPQLEHIIESVIPIIAKAQRPDGYIHTHVLVRQRNGDSGSLPFQDRHNFEMYNMGHLLTAASIHYRATGRTNLLSVARRTADFLYDTFRDASPEAARSSVCPSHYMGIVELYRTMRNPRDLELARTFFDLREQIKEGGDDNQDRIPFRQQTNAVGHAVRANYLYAGAADLFMETGDRTLWAPLEPIWTNVVHQKMHITGGCGALYDGASPDGARNQRAITRTHQAYGRNYQLPNVTAHNETCANIGNVLWNWRMFLTTGEPRFIEIVERALHNSVLSGVGLDGTNFFYVNPLRTINPLPTELRWSRTRVPFVSAYCCPPNLIRTIAESASYAYAKTDDAVWITLYGGSSLRTELTSGPVALTQETEYPWNGRIRITIDDCPRGEFALKLRIPDWADGATLRLNKLLSRSAPRPGTFYELRRVWKSGDQIDLDLPMRPRLMESHPLVEETLNQIAIQRGPIVYCLESVDLPRGVQLMDIAIPPDADLVARFDRNLLGGIAVLEGIVQVRESQEWNGELYRELKAYSSKPVEVRFIPYSVWGNRGPSEMTVWLPLSNTAELQSN